MIKNSIQLFIAIGILFFVFDTNAQKIDIEELKAMKIRNIGPAGMSGRVTTIDVVESNTDIIYAGTASGGVWRSTSGGIDWKPIFDKQPLSSVGALAIQQSNPDVIWVGTGEGNPRNYNVLTLKDGAIKKQVQMACLLQNSLFVSESKLVFNEKMHCFIV